MSRVLGTHIGHTQCTFANSFESGEDRVDAIVAKLDRGVDIVDSLCKKFQSSYRVAQEHNRNGKNKNKGLLKNVLITSESPSKKSFKTPSITLRKVSSAWPLGRAANTSYVAEGERLS